MTTSRIRVALLFGGRSSEHAISCATAGGVLGAIDRERFEVIPVRITREGAWTLERRDATGQHRGVDIGGEPGRGFGRGTRNGAHVGARAGIGGLLHAHPGPLPWTWTCARDRGIGQITADYRVSQPHRWK